MADLIKNQQIREYSKLEWFAKGVVEGFITGKHKSPFHGFSVEFAEHRHYNPGDSTRHVDWKLYARTDKHFVKRYEEETNLRCHLVLDCSSSMYFPESAEGQTKIDFAIKSGAALIQLFKMQRDAVGVTFFTNEVNLHIPAKLNNAHLNRVYHELELLQQKNKPNESTSVFKAINEVAERVPKRSLVILFSDLLEPQNHDSEALFNALQHLRFNRHEVVIFNVLDGDKELALNYENRMHTFVDAETGEKVKLNPAQLQESYKTKTAAYLGAIKLKCMQYGIDFVNADIRHGFDTVLKEYLVKRSKMTR